jgi:zinc/manganese transport system ATP-binding protein
VTPLLELEEVTVALGGRVVLDRVRLSVADGQFTGLIGSNGAGKTTLLRVALGLLTPQRGRVLIGGHPPRRRAALVGYVPQKVELDPDLPLRVEDLVGLGLDGHRLGLPLPSKTRAARVAEALEAAGAAHLAGQRAGRLSGGEQQRVMIAHAIVAHPRLLLLDEPLANLDLPSAKAIVAVLASVAAERGVGVLVSAHDVNPLLPVMDQVAYMAGGRLAAGPTGEVIRSEVLSELYGHPVEVVRVRDRVLVVAG